MTIEGLSHTYACIHSPPNSCPIQAVTKHWAELPVLHSRMFLFCKWVHWYLFSESKYKSCLMFVFLWLIHLVLKGYCWAVKRSRGASRGEEFNPGPMMRFDHSELLCNKVLLKYKRDRETFWHRHQKGTERVPPCQSLCECHIATSRLLTGERKCLKTQRLASGPSPTTCILR